MAEVLIRTLTSEEFRYLGQNLYIDNVLIKTDLEYSIHANKNPN